MATAGQLRRPHPAESQRLPAELSNRGDEGRRKFEEPWASPRPSEETSAVPIASLAH